MHTAKDIWNPFVNLLQIGEVQNHGLQDQYVNIYPTGDILGIC